MDTTPALVLANDLLEITSNRARALDAALATTKTHDEAIAVLVARDPLATAAGLEQVTAAVIGVFNRFEELEEDETFDYLYRDVADALWWMFGGALVSVVDRSALDETVACVQGVLAARWLDEPYLVELFAESVDNLGWEDALKMTSSLS